MENDQPYNIEIPNYKIRIVNVDYLKDLRDSIENLNKQKCFDKEFYDERLASFDYQPPKDFPDARSIFIVALRDPIISFTFYWKGKEIRAFVPPTYIHHREKNQRSMVILNEYFGNNQLKLVQANLPKKLLAVSGGLGDYGRNNIVYVGGMGSYHRLMAFYSDYPPEQDVWRGPQMMAACEHCDACFRNCPVGAISKDRFLIRAEHCLTYWNEKPQNINFPNWIKPDWHNCLIGCMRCQSICPEDRDVWKYIEDGCNFSEVETRQMADGVPIEDMPSDLREKLARWDLVDIYEYIPRNLAALL